MNSNIEALVGILNDHVHYRMTNREVAEVLAAHSCLAVDSLTDEQATWTRDFWTPDGVRAALRRCATGEPE